ncbi:DUF397 domain-containing protein [Streptomyces sp. NPDC001858]
MTAPGNWQKSSFSGGGEGNDCLELASTPTTLHIRESEDPTTVLTSTASPFSGLLAGIRAGSV